MVDTVIEKYAGIEIRKSEDGYHGSNGPAVSFGYTDTIEELRAEIDDYWSGDEHGELNGFFAEGVA